MRRVLVVGNWKMHGNCAFAAQLAGAIARTAPEYPDVEVALCPAFVLIPAAAAALAGSRVAIGAQTLSEHPEGAYTGEVSAPMLKNLGCRYVIVGHSERRQLFGETSAQAVAKLVSAGAAGLVPILCVGETLAERKRGATEAVIEEQLAPLLALPEAPALLASAVIAYEPVWAIGTGETASPEQAQTVHTGIRARLGRHGREAVAALRILYGGSVKPANAAALFAMPDVDGGLIGGAALSAGDFSAICRVAQARAMALN